jgi:hypothetical protein
MWWGGLVAGMQPDRVARWWVLGAVRCGGGHEVRCTVTFGFWADLPAALHEVAGGQLDGSDCDAVSGAEERSECTY